MLKISKFTNNYIIFLNTIKTLKNYNNFFIYYLFFKIFKNNLYIIFNLKN